jgi:DNA-binding transcriptional regulator YdaS (Cro superfamily)
MRLDHYLKPEGSAKALAAALQIPEPTVSQWKNGKRRVPADWCIDIEKATAGAVTCEELRPDVDWAYLRQSCPCATPAAQAA